MIWYVHRRNDGSIASAHSEIRPGYAEEALRDDHPDLATYHEAGTVPPAWTPLEFLERFSKQERTTIRAAANQSDDLADWIDLLRASTEVIATDPRTVAGMQALVDAGLITSPRRDAILGA